MQELIEFLEKRGLKEKADNLRNGDISLNLNGRQIDESGAKYIVEFLNYNKGLVKKLAVLISCYFSKKNQNIDYSFKILTANKFYKVVNKPLLKKSLEDKKTTDIEFKLKEVDDFIEEKAFTIANVCKNIKPDKYIADGGKHISHLPIEVINHIVSYLDHDPWGLNVKTSLTEEKINTNHYELILAELILAGLISVWWW
ncbi:hypothetical protein [Rickettsia endosymbiont of Halotydeus destructor]|uniref:hypothetical protein n=1 Tax=Rickettsia endosymbiont of Halotydeus destructor TaxID=2996754 RepID=UPI003BB021FC